MRSLNELAELLKKQLYLDRARVSLLELRGEDFNGLSEVGGPRLQAEEPSAPGALIRLWGEEEICEAALGIFVTTLSERVKRGGSMALVLFELL